MAVFEHLAIHNGLGIYRPHGKYSLVDAVDLVTCAITHCRESKVNMLLVDATGFIDLPIPTLLDRFLMVEDWAQEAMRTVVVAMVASPEHMHPRKFGVKVALQFGLICDVYSSEEDASAWLLETASHVK